MPSPYLALVVVFITSYAAPSSQYGFGRDCECSDITLLDTSSGQILFGVDNTYFVLFFFRQNYWQLSHKFQGQVLVLCFINKSMYGLEKIQQGKRAFLLI
eukprot:TRINITY_DN13417_c0_g1_i1.p2 TRINITY_DN13417_c0_g1~~TRINITY_DN13417_c0_g1_i1.p2  ORF type:complete len:100 (-),score=8.78 TRINITY_DN13417_c0_g1_i1:87-386(-)